MRSPLSRAFSYRVLPGKIDRVCLPQFPRRMFSSVSPIRALPISSLLAIVSPCFPPLPELFSARFTPPPLLQHPRIFAVLRARDFHREEILPLFLEVFSWTRQWGSGAPGVLLHSIGTSVHTRPATPSSVPVSVRTLRHAD